MANASLGGQGCDFLVVCAGMGIVTAGCAFWASVLCCE